MKNSLRQLMFLLLSFLLLDTPAFGQWAVSKIAEKYTPSVVSITALDEKGRPLTYGSGFFINSGGDMVTSHHVLAGCVKARIKTSRNEEGEILGVIKDDPGLDLSVVKTSFRNTVPLALGDSDTVKVGEDVLIIGNPAMHEESISLGALRAILRGEEITLLQSTAPILPGSSGGPVLNLKGQVIGIATAFLDMGQNLSFAMPVNYLKALKHTRMKLWELPTTTIKLEAVIRDKVSIEAIDVYYQTSMGHVKEGARAGLE